MILMFGILLAFDLPQHFARLRINSVLVLVVHLFHLFPRLLYFFRQSSHEDIRVRVTPHVIYPAHGASRLLKSLRMLFE